MTDPNPHWAGALVGALAATGVRHVCVSPGSRLTPLTLAVAAHPTLTSSVHIDERSAAFFALGYGRATGRPAALVCTSGTAGANYYPAVIEAHYSRVPLVVLTADRPPELRDSGAWQTIDQLRLYGGYTRWFVELGLPSDAPGMLRYARDVAARAVAVACGRPSGPVHLNVPFREPLAPEGGRSPLAEAPSAVQVPPSEARVPDEVLDALAMRIAATPRGLILAGRVDGPIPDGYAAALDHLAAAAGYPLLAEPTGGLRYGPHVADDGPHDVDDGAGRSDPDAPRTDDDTDGETAHRPDDDTDVANTDAAILTGYDAFLRLPDWADAHPPALVLRFGASFTWKYAAQYLERHPDAHQVIVDPDQTWDDPTRAAAQRLLADPVPLARQLAQRLAQRERGEPETRARWRSAWRSADQVAAAHRATAVADGDSPTVAWVYPALLDALPDGAQLYAANSMAVRDLDTFSAPRSTAVRALANRGAAGIDGTLSSALGAAYGGGVPTALVTGDLAFVHDINGLAVSGLEANGRGDRGRDASGSGVRSADRLDLTVVVLNDGGGGIFRYLPVSDEVDPERFERYFLTPPGVDLGAACRAYGAPHVVAPDRAALRQALAGAVGIPGVHVIEVPVDMAANTAMHRRLWDGVARALEEG